jgi:hypothetical protein
MAYCTIQELAYDLGMAVTAANTPKLQACVDAAACEIDDAVDRPQMVVAEVDWLFDVATVAADPGAGQLRMDRTNPNATTALYISKTDADGGSWDTTLGEGDVVRLHEAANTARWEQFTLTDASLDHVSWVEMPVGRTDGSASPLELADGMRLTATALQVTPLLTRQLALAHRVNVARGVEWWKASDTVGASVIGSEQTGQLAAPRSGFSVRYGTILTPLKQQWGIA